MSRLPDNRKFTPVNCEHLDLSAVDNAGLVSRNGLGTLESVVSMLRFSHCSDSPIPKACQVLDD